MKLIESIEQLEKNLETVEYYITEGSDAENKEATRLICAGTCFVAYEIDGQFRFAPSRFIGYKNNTINQHRESTIKHGTITNGAINRIMDNRLEPNEELEKAFLKYCHNLGIEPYNKKRKYWKLNLSKEFNSNIDLDGEYPEGKMAERKHIFRERDSKVVQLAKQNFKNKHGRLFCQACEFDFEKEYGEIGVDFIEAHHSLPLSEMKDGHITKIDDFAMLCPNCHRMIHKKRPWVRMEDLMKLRSNNNKKLCHD